MEGRDLHHIWLVDSGIDIVVSQNFGIIVAFGIGFFIALLVFTEYMTSAYHQSSVVLFRRGHGKIRTSADEESGSPNEKEPLPESHKKMEVEAIEAQAPMTDVFSWRHVNYRVPIAGEEDRQLLDDVSGYVAPGKLTALMGESGAGKTTLLNVLAQMNSTGVVTGDILVNGQSLPHDFQAQTYVPIWRGL